MSVLLKNKTHLVLLLIILLGGSIRLLGVNPGFNQYHSDEGISYSAAVSMIKNKDLDPLRYDYPAIVPEINFISFKTIFIPIGWIHYYVTHISQILDGYQKLIPTLEEIKIISKSIFGDREVNALFWGRYTTAFVSTLSILLIFLLTKRLFNQKVALIAAFLLAINFRSVTNSHIGLPDTYNAFFMLLSLFSSCNIFKDKSLKSYIFASACVGLSIATKYQTFIVFPFLFAHFFNENISLSLNKFIVNIFDKKLYISFVVIFLVFFALNPYLLIHLEESVAWVSSVSTKYAMGRKILNLFPVHYWLHVDFGFGLFATIISGALLLFIKRRKESLFLLAELLPFLFVMLYYSVGGFYVRNFITITPIYLLFSAYAVHLLYEFLHKKTKYIAFVAVAALLGGISFNSIQNDFIHTTNYLKPWNYKSILQTAQIIPPASTVAGHPFDPLPADKDLNRIDIKAASLYSLSEVRDAEADYAYINLDWAADPFYGWMTRGFPENSLYLFQKPYREMRETFWGLSIEEMMHFVVAHEYKPWQAPEAALFIIKVPHFQNKQYSQLTTNGFLDWFEEDAKDSNEGFLSKGADSESIAIGPGNGIFNITRYTSAHMTAQPGYLYKVQANLTAQTSVEKNVFIRINYYSQDSRHLLTAVSQRFEGKESALMFESQAPMQTSYFTISIQASNALAQKVEIHNLSVFESKTSFEYPELKTIPYEEYRDILYPNSHGNL